MGHPKVKLTHREGSIGQFTFPLVILVPGQEDTTQPS